MLDGISGYGTKPFRMLLVILAVIVSVWYAILLRALPVLPWRKHVA